MAGRTSSARHAPPSGRTRGYGTRGHAPPSGRTRRAQDSRACHAVFRTRPAQDSRAANGPGTTGRHPPGTTGRARRAVIRRATPGCSPTGRHPSGHATRVGSIRHPQSAAFLLGVVEPPNAGRQLRRWRASEGWRTPAGGGCQAMRVWPTVGAPGMLGCQNPLKVVDGRAVNRP